MAVLDVHEMRSDDEQYVGACSHVGESAEVDASAKRRLAYLGGAYEAGARTFVATLDGSPAGFLYLMPSGIAPWGPIGDDLAVITCLWVPKAVGGQGIGRALLEAAESAARRRGATGLATIAYYHDFWFMPVSYFERMGYRVAERQASRAVLWKPIDLAAPAPRLRPARFEYVPSQAPVTVDLFYVTLCLTSDMEAERVREVAGEFAGDLLLREHRADDPAVRDRSGISRGIYVNGKEIGWGYEAPREGLREAFGAALAAAKR